MKYLFLVLLLSLCFSADAQKRHKGDTIQITSRAMPINIPARTKPVEEKPLPFDSIKKELDDYVTSMKDQKFISDNVEVSMEVEIIYEPDGKDIQLIYSYNLKNKSAKYSTDDFSLGQYTLDASNAMKVTLDLIKRNIEKQFLPYLNAGKKVSFIINGCADASPIRKSIPYRGEFGKQIGAVCQIGDKQEQIEINTQKGINSNQQLAFLRSWTVRDFILHNIPLLQNTQNTFFHKAEVSKFKGGEHRRVSIEIIIHQAFENKQ